MHQPVEAMNTAYLQFIDRCSGQPDGFVATSASVPWRLGAVLMAQYGGEFVTIRKSPADGGAYEFGGLYALPGGMVRTDDCPLEATAAATVLVEASLRARVFKEASLALAAVSAISFCKVGPVVSSYSVKGNARFTLVAPYASSLEERAALHADDHSVDACTWMSCDAIPWDRFAPANCVIMAHRLWAILADRERDSARPYIARSVAQCSRWAHWVGLPAVPLPWDGPGLISAWRNAWEAIG